MRIALLLAAAAAIASAQPFDLVVKNARVWTGDAKQPFADSLGVRADILTAVGGVGDAAAGRVIDAGGRLITPGFIDSHVHLIAGGLRLGSVQLRDAKTRQMFVDRIKAFAAKQPEGTWITGGDWDHELWGGELPTRQWIDAVTPKHPVWVHRLDGHMALANSLALKLAGVTRNVRAVPGGVIERDAKGEPSGVLKDNALELVDQAVPPASQEAKAAALSAAMGYLLQFGVTSVHDMSADGDLGLIRNSLDARAARVRVYAAAPLSGPRNLSNFVDREGRGDRWVRWGLLKGFQDGSLGSKTAAMESDYADAPGSRGMLVTPPEQIYESVISAFNLGFQVAIHAIGDRANSLLLDVFERVAQVIGPGAQRMRIEHAQHLKPADIPRFAKHGIIASMQPYHLADDGRWAERVIGAGRSKTTYAFRSLLDAGAVLAFGSDWFVAPPDVMAGIHAAVTRQTLDGKHPDGWTPEQKITVAEALKAYTGAGAYAANEESYKGVLSKGMLADFVMLDKDILKIPPATIKDAKVLLTVVGGRIAYERKP
jgi:predicted amidohydrolase YtcJ